MALALMLASLVLPCPLWAQQEDAPPAPRDTDTPVMTTNGQTVIKAEREFVETVSFDFSNVPLPAVLDYLSQKTGRNFLMTGDMSDILITLHLENIDWRRALDLIANRHKLVVEDDGRVVSIKRPPLITMHTKTDTDIRQIIQSIAEVSGANIIISESVKGSISVNVDDVPWTRVLESVCQTAGFAIVEEKNAVLRIVHPEVLALQLETRVFPLKYIQPPDSYRPVMTSDYAVGNTQAPQRDMPAIMAGASDAYARGVADSLRAAEKREGAAPEGAEAAASNFPVMEAVSRVLSKEGRVSFDHRTNSLIVTDIAPNIGKVEQMIAKLDVEPEQVFVDCRFVTTTNTDFLEFGTDWGLNGPEINANGGAMAHRLPFNLGKRGFEDRVGLIRNSPRPFVDGVAPTIANTDILPGAVSPGLVGGGLYQFGVLDFSGLAPTLSFLKNDIRTEVEQAPKLLMLDHQEATIFVGETIRYAEAVTATANNSAATGVVEAASSPVDTGFQLLVQPHIVRGTDKIILTVIPKQSSLSAQAGAAQGQIPGFNRFQAGGQTIDLPQVTTSTLVTKLMLRSGQTAVLGGLVQETDDKTVRKWPILGDIPIIDFLFKSETYNKTRENFIVLMTVHLVRNDSDLRTIYQDHRGHLGKFDRWYKDDDEAGTKDSGDKGKTASDDTKTDAGDDNAAEAAEPATSDASDIETDGDPSPSEVSDVGTRSWRSDD